MTVLNNSLARLWSGQGCHIAFPMNICQDITGPHIHAGRQWRLLVAQPSCVQGKDPACIPLSMRGATKRCSGTHMHAAYGASNQIFGDEALILKALLLWKLKCIGDCQQQFVWTTRNLSLSLWRLECKEALSAISRHPCVQMQVTSIAAEFGLAFLNVGFDPKWQYEDVPKMPKQRYR